MENYGPWLNEWPSIISEGSRWEWKTHDNGRWDINECPGQVAIFRAVPDGLWPESFSWGEAEFETAWTEQDFGAGESIRQILSESDEPFVTEDEAFVIVQKRTDGTTPKLCKTLGMVIHLTEEDAKEALTQAFVPESWEVRRVIVKFS